ncbi:MAG: CCA tRNA nucleotidyltransferase, mitochondrial [Cirrosporium novae-zelandiae]|nr:MAG: CCA tRNA nucleotidyltransferase, mitochondrial [Cirrosporium novae-zelandiae]
MSLNVKAETSNVLNPFKRTAVTRSPSPSAAESSKIKRRKLSHLTHQEPMGPAAMDPVIQLTPEEQELKKLLLDVTSWVQRKPDTPQSRDGEIQPPDTALELRFAGGWVRDKLLGVNSQDIDVALSSMTGEVFGEALLEYLEDPDKDGDRILGGHTLHKIKANPEKSKHLETSTMKLLGIDVDFVNLRKETYTEDSRNPQMSFGTPEEDAIRRDATINALFYNIHTSKVEDLTGKGLADMELKIMRTPLPPYQTFKDDPLRVMRLIRFASRLDYTIDEEAGEAMKNKDIQEAFTAKISRERVGIELRKMLRGPSPLSALRYIHNFGLYSTVFVNPKILQQYQTIKLGTTVFATPESAHLEPAIKNWEKAYTALQELMKQHPSESKIYNDIRSILIVSPEQQYHCWLLASLVPWIVVQPPKDEKEIKQIPSAASTVARYAIDAPNEECSIIDGAVKNREEIARVKDLVAGIQTLSEPESDMNNPLSRSSLGVAIRKWGSHWRSQIVLLYLMDSLAADDRNGRNNILQDYLKLVSRFRDEDLLDVCSLQPIVSGDDLMKALNSGPGKWLQAAKDMALRFQLEYHEAKPEDAIKFVLEHKAELNIRGKVQKAKKKQKTKKQT